MWAGADELLIGWRRLTAASRDSRLLDELGHLTGPGDQRQVRGLYFLDRGASTFGHEALCSGRDRPVLGPEEVPGANRLPRRGGRRPSGRRQRERTLGYGEDRGNVL